MSTPEPRAGHPFSMYDEMQAQPGAVAAALAADDEQRAHVAKELAGTHSRTDSIVGPGFLAPSLVGRGRIWLAGCGTAHHAALTGAEWLRQFSEGTLDAQAMHAFEFAHNLPGGARPHDALLALSHSGTASATIAAAEQAKTRGMYTVALTADPASPIAQVCDETLRTMTTPTVAATYTISHLTMLAVLADLALRAANDLREGRAEAHELAPAVADLPNALHAALASEPAVRAVVAALPRDPHMVLAGGGVLWHAALEGALKLREAAYLPSTGMEIEEVLHGPLASFDAQTVLVLLAPRTSTGRARAPDILRAVRRIGVTTVLIGDADDADLVALATHHLALPAAPDWLSVVPATALLQVFTYWLAMQRGGNPDRIRRDQPQWQAARDEYTR